MVSLRLGGLVRQPLADSCSVTRGSCEQRRAQPAGLGELPAAAEPSAPMVCAPSRLRTDPCSQPKGEIEPKEVQLRLGVESGSRRRSRLRFGLLVGHRLGDRPVHRRHVRRRCLFPPALLLSHTVILIPVARTRTDCEGTYQRRVTLSAARAAGHPAAQRQWSALARRECQLEKRDAGAVGNRGALRAPGGSLAGTSSRTLAGSTGPHGPGVALRHPRSAISAPCAHFGIRHSPPAPHGRIDVGRVIRSTEAAGSYA